MDTPTTSVKQQAGRDRNWYAIHTYAGYENAVAKNLQQQKAKFTLKSGWGFLLFVAVIALSAWAMLTNKFTPAMLSNPAKVVPTETTPTYKVW